MRMTSSAAVMPSLSNWIEIVLPVLVLVEKGRLNEDAGLETAE
jgi:hypothetical protein